VNVPLPRLPQESSGWTCACLTATAWTWRARCSVARRISVSPFSPWLQAEEVVGRRAVLDEVAEDLDGAAVGEREDVLHDLERPRRGAPAATAAVLDARGCHVSIAQLLGGVLIASQRETLVALAGDNAIFDVPG